MTYKISWSVPDRVIEVAFPEISNDEAVKKFDSDLIAMLDTASQPVHVILDARSVKVYPSAQTSIKVGYYKHPRMGSLIIIGLSSNPILRFLASLVGRTVGIRIRDFPTPEDAHAYLKTLDPS